MAIATHDAWQAAQHLTDGARITVRYESNRSDKMLEKEGEVKNVTAPSPDTKEDFDLDYDLRIELMRDDGQRMYVYDSMELHTAKSMHPFVGDVVEIEIDGGVEDPVSPPEPATTAFEKSLIAAENAQRSQTNPTNLDILEAALDRLKELDVTPKEDWSDDKFQDWMGQLANRTQLEIDE